MSDADILSSFPPGFLAEVAAILRAGGKRHGCAPHETGGGQTLVDHVSHLKAHAADAERAVVVGDHAHDPDSGASQWAHVGARAALAYGLEKAGR